MTITSAFTPSGQLDMVAVLGGDPHIPNTPAGLTLMIGLKILGWDVQEGWDQWWDATDQAFEDYRDGERRDVFGW
jgi:hypothetical protein